MEGARSGKPAIRVRPAGKSWTTALLVLGLVLAVPVLSADERAGQEVAQRVHDRPAGGDSVTRGTMTLSGPGSRERVRDTYIYRRDGPDGQRWTLVRFTSPANVADTGLLVHNFGSGAESDQWLYLPAAQRVRRISSANRGGSFVQSDLYFEDLQDRVPTIDTHRLLGIEEYQGAEVYVLESSPRDATSSVYTKWTSWIDRETLIPLRVDLYQGGGDPVKRLDVQRVEQIQGYWTVMTSTMTTLASGHQTVMQVEAVIHDQGLPESLFTTRALADPSIEVRFRP